MYCIYINYTIPSSITHNNTTYIEKSSPGDDDTLTHISAAANMAASMRQLVRRVIRLSQGNNNTASAGAAGRLGRCWAGSCCRCFGDAAEDRSTHFGFETVSEAEKTKRGESLRSSPPPWLNTAKLFLLLSVSCVSRMQMWEAIIGLTF